MSLVGLWYCPYCRTLTDGCELCCDEMHMVEITEKNLDESMEYLGELA
jgi:hypothetical protein